MYKGKCLVNTKIMILVIIILLILLLFTPIGIRVIYDDTYSDIDIYLFKWIRYKLDLDEFIRKFITTKQNRDKVSLIAIINNLEILLSSKKTIKDLCKITTIEKSTIIMKQNYEDTFKFIMFWNIVSRYIYIIRKSFKKVRNQYYMISNLDKDLSVELIFKINVFKVLIIIIKNYKEVINLIKIRRRQKNNGTTNM